MMFSKKRSVLAIGAALAMTGSTSLWATNGMNLEGYGPVALGMGGASFAYDNGTAAVMNNPATLGLMKEDSRLDLALGFLGPDITVRMDMGEMGSMSTDSGGDAYWMPAAGYMRRSGDLVYGIGVYAQGGMGTEYRSDSFMAGTFGEHSRSELTHGRAVLPVAYNVNNQLTVAGSLDLVWAGLDLVMPMTAAQMGVGGVSVGGSMAPLFPMFGFGNNPYDSAQFKFTNGSDISGRARGYGVAGKLGLHYQVNDRLAFGATYHSKTNLDDLDSDASISVMTDAITEMMGGPYKIRGKIKVVDFQWPETYGLGVAFKATDRLVLAADVKQINLSNTMDEFKLSFRAHPDYLPPGAESMNNLTVSMPLDWDDQTVVGLGAAYMVSDPLTVRVGYNHASNPVPDSTLNPYFPATVEDHFTAGFSYQFSDNGTFHFAASYADEVKDTNPGGTIPGYATVPPVEVEHSQLNWQAMFSFNF